MQDLKPLPEYDSVTIYPHFNVLSSSQFLTYEKDPQKFYTEYVIGAKNGGTVKMAQGRIFSAMYADRSLPFREHLMAIGAKGRIADRFDYAIKLMPVLKGGSPEYPLLADFGGWGFRATLDDFVESQDVIIENKTGEKAWSQERADTDDQITFQAWCFWVKYKRLPKKIVLNWVDLRPSTNKFLHCFVTTRNVQDMQEFHERVQVVIDNLNAENFSTPLYS